VKPAFVDANGAFIRLASDEARWVTGVMLPIDGGFQRLQSWPR
jgi:NAD(P)-dependent dehydrogenase (short-subunit alcohol dehydrogenase family)